MKLRSTKTIVPIKEESKVVKSIDTSSFKAKKEELLTLVKGAYKYHQLK